MQTQAIVLLKRCSQQDIACLPDRLHAGPAPSHLSLHHVILGSQKFEPMLSSLLVLENALRIRPALDAQMSEIRLESQLHSELV